MRKWALLGLLTGIALILFVLESFLPQLIPGGRIGLSQLVTLLVLFWFGWREAATVLIARVLLGSLFAGGLMNPVFVLSLGGGIAALLVMALSLEYLPMASPLGISVLGAAAHNLAQLALASLFLVGQASVWNLLPYFLWASLVSGTAIGLIAYWIGMRVENFLGV